MKTLLTTLLIAFTLTANAQDIYVAADANKSFDTPQRVDVGISFNVADNTKLQLFTGYTNKANSGNYTQLGIGTQHYFNFPLTVAFDVRGVIGEKTAGTLERTSQNEIGVGYSTFVGIRLADISIGASLEQYVLTHDEIFISPVAVRANF